MKHTLVTLLGRARLDKETGYQRAKYLFPGEDTPRETPFLGMALARYLKLDAAIILGTRGSQWSVLVEHIAQGHEAEDARIELLDAESQFGITQAMLDRVAPIMSRAVDTPVTPRLIPFGKDAAEQYEILEAIAGTVANGDVSFDLTHGFRHLGMVGFLSAFMLERVRNLHVRDLWYGALDMTDRASGLTPVLRLDGLTRVRRWVDALDRFDATGDYGVFAPLLLADGVGDDKAGCLERAAFHERTLNLADAARQIETFPEEPRRSSTGGCVRLVPEPPRGTASLGPGGRLGRPSAQAGLRVSEARDFMRAAVFGWEALATLECGRRRLRPDEYRTGRKPAIDGLVTEMDAGDHPEWKRSAFLLLRDIRNALAHGSPPGRRDARQALRDPERLHAALENSFQRLLAVEAPAPRHAADPAAQGGPPT